MDIYIERGYSKGDCLHRIVKKHGIYFTVLREKTIPARFMGLLPEKVEVEYYLSYHRNLGLPGALDPSPVPPKQPSPKKQENSSTIDFNQEKRRLLAAAGKDPDKAIMEAKDQEEREAAQQQEILAKLKEIQEQIGPKNAVKEDPPNLARISEMLRQNDFSQTYITGLLNRARKELSLDTLEDFNAVQDRFVEWIGESISIFEEPRRPGVRILALVGPTGVGKTTTIAKLAAIFGIENSGRRPLTVRMITIDAFRIGAKKQIEDFGDIMEIPVSYVENRRDLRREIDLHREETDLILVDTIGMSPSDSARLGEMKELLDACGSKAEIHLALFSGTKTSDMEHILRQFEPFGYQAVLLTKFDETRHVGNIISALAERDKPISYITDGQSVPKDIKKASVVRFLVKLDDFRIDREKIEKRFPVPETEQFLWG